MSAAQIAQVCSTAAPSSQCEQRLDTDSLTLASAASGYVAVSFEVILRSDTTSAQLEAIFDALVEGAEDGTLATDVIALANTVEFSTCEWTWLGYYLVEPMCISMTEILDVL